MGISIHIRLESDTIHLPEAAGLVGKEVRITVVEEPFKESEKDMSALEQLAGKIDLDWGSIS